MIVRMGDKVPADLLIFASTDLKVDNSSLTGEADPQERSKKNTQENPLEATNLVFNGTLVVNGEPTSFSSFAYSSNKISS